MFKINISLVATLLMLTACSQGPESPRGFSLPKGDPVLGLQVFVDYQCLACHILEGEDRGELQPQLPTLVKLGGEVSRVVTYADLVTSIINPSHRLARGYKKAQIQDEGSSKMRNFNDVMTVSELINLVAFLQPKYPPMEIDYTTYSQYQ